MHDDHPTDLELGRLVERLCEQNQQLVDRVADLENELEETQNRLERLEAEKETLESQHETLEAEHETLEDENDALRETTDRLRDRLEDCEDTTNHLEAATDATRKRTGANKARIEELQARELEKGAHLQTENVDRCELEVTTNHLEKITKDDGRTYYRLPESADPLERDNAVALAHGDLLPIQQLARMDEEMLRSTTNALPTRLAARLWRARTDPSVGDDPWQSGCKGIREYVKASDLKHWIRRQEPGTSEAYAKKLVSRTIDAALELSKNRLAVRKKTERKNGLEYTERRLILPDDADVPGEPEATTDHAPETADVFGDP